MAITNSRGAFIEFFIFRPVIPSLSSIAIFLRVSRLIDFYPERRDSVRRLARRVAENR